MVSARWKGSLVATLAWAGLAWGQASPAPSPPLGIGRDLLTVREAGRPDQKCRILKAWKESNGAMALEVQCLETEEHLTIVEIPSHEGGLTDSSKGMKSRIYHWGQSLTPPAGVPQMPAPHPQEPKIQVIEKSETDSVSGPALPPANSLPLNTTNKPESGYPLPPPPEVKLPPVEVEKAKPTNWHESWGKAEDHHTELTVDKIPQTEEKLPQTPPANSEAQPVKPQTVPSNPPETIIEQSSNNVAPETTPMTDKISSVSESTQPAGYSHIDDRPGIAHVTDIPPVGTPQTASESKKPIMDFVRSLLKPSLKEPAPLQTIQLAELPAAPPPAAPSGQQLETVLRDSVMPSEREMAAEVLSGFHPQQDPTIVPALLRSAAEDPAGTVRAACVHGLVKMNANNSEVVGVLMNLKADPDHRVRREVNQALISFGLLKPEPENEMVHQISGPAGRMGE
jgi:hypothetical protein